MESEVSARLKLVAGDSRPFLWPEPTAVWAWMERGRREPSTEAAERPSMAVTKKMKGVWSME